MCVSRPASGSMSGSEHLGEDPVLLAELIVRHTRRHMPTRRVALESAYLPTSGPAHGPALLAALVATNLPAVDDDGQLVIEIDAHGAQVPQVLGAVLGASWLPGSGRDVALDVLRRIVEGR